ncbi:hypothetical protein [Frigidibacter sp. ROC022]|uniref:hypothetical protein n=1 Tax=Frigidibacter sp. ROC022 TaxID=2971796 RepID=UPI00215B0A5E|nr:hypothetical protein [Frigidibacter sp. ROC022]MCR8726299.1 hypothetical protein [Frigidibacter sp. ROC022]
MLPDLAGQGLVGLIWALIYLWVWLRAQGRSIPARHPLLAVREPALTKRPGQRRG